VVCLEDGSVLVAGRFFGPRTTFGGIEAAGSGGWDGFVVKFDAAGQALWALGLGGAGSDGLMDITLDAGGGFAVTGYAQGPLELRGRDGASIPLQGHGGRDVLTAGFDQNGNVLWARLDGGPDEETGLAIASDPGGDLAVTGWFEGQALFGEGELEEVTLQSFGDRDLFVMKLERLGP
jgi:hypothetical protein